MRLIHKILVNSNIFKQGRIQKFFEWTEILNNFLKKGGFCPTKGIGGQIPPNSKKKEKI